MATNLALVEDNPADVLFLQHTLERHYPGQYATTVATTLGEAKGLLARQAFDAVVLDLSLPDSQGLETIGQLAAAAPKVPIVVFSGVADARIVPEAVRCGAQDYLLKGQSDGATIARVIRYAIDRKRAEQELRAQRRELEAKNKELQEAHKRLEAYRDRYVNLYDFAPLGYVTLDADGYVQEINLAGARLLNADRDALTGYPFSAYVAQEDVPAFLARVRKCVDEHCEVTFELRLAAQAGRLLTAQLNCVPVEGSAEDVTFCRTAITDITQRKQTESRLARFSSLKEQLLGPGNLTEKLQRITDGVVELFGAELARIWTLDEGDLCEQGCPHDAVTAGPEVCRDRSRCLHLAASSGCYTPVDGGHRRVPVGCHEIGRIAAGEDTKFVTNDVTHDPRVGDCGWAANLGLVSFAGYGLLAPQGAPLGVLALFSKQLIDADDDALLADYANIAAQVIATGRAEELLRREMVFADIVIDSIPGVFYVLDNQGRFVRWNRFLEEITGLTGEMLRGSDALRTIVADDRQRVAAKIREVFDSGLAEVQARLLGKHGVRDFWFTGRRMDAGLNSYLVGSGIDITDSKRMEEEIRRSRDELEIRVQERTAELARANVQLSSAKDAAEAASRAKSTFLANMSHEIRTPLNAVIGMTELVLQGPLSVEQREFLQTVRDSGEALLSAINDILDFSKIEAGKLALAVSAFDLRERLGDTMKSFAIRARQQGLKLACFIRPEVPRIVLGDYSRLRQVVVNLVGNAIKFTERGEVVLEVMRESLSEKDVVLHFVVADTGIGIPPERQSAVFEMFEQADTSLTRRHGGTGLGLAIASRLVGLMGGRIWVESEVGRGSRFHVILRLDLADSGPPQPKAELPATAAQPRQVANLRILLAEDSLVNQKLAVALLERQGHKVKVVNNGRAAIEALQTEKIDLVLMDVQMPEMNGLMATEIIRAKEQHSGAHIPIIAMTAHSLKGDRERCLAPGMDGYIAKPIHAEELFATIDAVCSAAPPPHSCTTPST